MTARWITALALLITTCVVARSADSPAPTRNWPQFRGPNASGIAESASPPVKWNVEEKQNVGWKTPIPGLGHSSPIIWEDKVFVTSAISGKENPELKVGLYGDIAPVEDDTSHRFMVYCLDRNSGKMLWERTAFTGKPKVKRHTKATHANSTMATDGKRVVAFFGSEGLYCYDLNGKPLWKQDFGMLDSGYFMVPSAQWGFASSPIIQDDMVIAQCDLQQGSFVAALNAKTGKEIWRNPRNEVPTWSTPTVVDSGGRKQVVLNGWKHIAGYDLKSGLEYWRLTGGGDIPVPTPVAGQGLIYITNAHGRMAPIYAIKDSASGNISLLADATSNSHIPWSHHREGGYMQTPIVYGDYLYVCRDHGVLSCYNAKTGERVYNERLGTGRTGFTASGVAADGRLYYSSEEGDIYVVKAGPKFELLAQNPMGEVCMATPAISGDTLYFRTRGHLVAIAEKK